MTRMLIERGEQRWRIAAHEAIDISIPLDFGGAQPNFFQAPPARATPYEVAGFIGEVAWGGSCNCSVLTLTPHCNGTHTECVGHIVDERVSVNELAPAAPLHCLLATLTPRKFAASIDDAMALGEPGDLVIDRQAIEPLLDGGALKGMAALVIRTQPNAPDKRTRNWSQGGHPYFTVAAIADLVAAGIEHLIVDLPSLDRADDAGRLAAHRAWWGLPQGSRRLSEATRARCTVTELAYIPDSVPDGSYLLSLQIAPFVADATPSRPILLPLRVER